MSRIGFLGTGLMGVHMARNLMHAGHELKVWNRSRDKADPLAADGAVVCETAGEAVSGAEIVVSMLANGMVTGAVIEDVVDSLSEGMIWVDMCSAHPEEARQQAARLAAVGVAHIDAPVSGGTAGAEQGKLAIMAGGDASDVNRLQAVFQPMGRAIHVGPSGSGQLAKLANQAIVAITIGAVAEAMLLLQKGGADPAAVRDALKGGFADSTILQQHGSRMTRGDFAPGGPIEHQIKDLKNVISSAEAVGAFLPMTEEALARYRYVSEALDGAGLDHSALYLELLDRQPK